MSVCSHCGLSPVNSAHITCELCDGCMQYYYDHHARLTQLNRTNFILAAVVGVGVLGWFIQVAAQSSGPAAGAVNVDQDPLDRLRLSQIQVIGTHNSYHVAPDKVAAKFLESVAPKEAAANDVSLPSLTEQLERLGLRQFELDLYLDPDGKLYRQPSLLELARQQNVEVPPHDPEGRLQKPGIKILHSPDFDFRTTAYSLVQALRDIKRWSDAHRDHVPVFVLLELKSDSFSPLTKPPAWDDRSLVQLEQEVESVFPRDRILTPDAVRSTHATLREAVLKDGWPTVAQTRGKVVFLLDNENKVRDLYLQSSNVLKDRLLFVSVAPSHPAAAWMKRNDPVGSFDDIQHLVKSGFLVRTRADSSTREARANDPTTRDKAFASGAQLISTDFPEPNPRFSEYVVRFTPNSAIRPNVVSGP